MDKVIKIANGRLVRRGGIAYGESVYIAGGEIAAVTDRPHHYDEEIDAQNCYVAPGFIDIHTHGAGGFDFMDGGTEPIIGAAAAHFAHGTTTLFPTTLACSTETLLSFLRDFRSVSSENLPGAAHMPGAHLEGPYFCQAQRGAQNPAYICNPNPDEYERILDVGEGLISRWSFAPELPGAVEFCKALVSRGIVPAIAHSEAVLEEVRRVYDEGCHLVTHLYSGMTGVVRKNAYRKLGVVESAFLLDNMHAELIADGHHLPPELLRLIYKIMGPERLILVTDSMRGAGQPDGPSMLGPQGESVPCIIEGGVAKLPDRSAFAGSVATADTLVRTMYKKVGIPLWISVMMLTENPARVMGLEKKGRLEPGCDADIVIFDEDIQIKRVIKSGTATTR